MMREPIYKKRRYAPAAAEFDKHCSRIEAQSIKAGLPLTDKTRAEMKHFIAEHPCGKHGNIIYKLKEDFGVDVFEEMVRVHLLSGHHLAQACLEKLSASTLPGGASVVGIASLTSFIANPFVPGYGAGKAGTVQLAKTQAALWAGRKIRSNCVAAGHIATRLTNPLVKTEELNKEILNRTPMKRRGQPKEIADAVIFLSSNIFVRHLPLYR
jgi:NAD(P)-dependent dehydrogenase (short-subunit alcohol dehydrogenase family)